MGNEPEKEHVHSGAGMAILRDKKSVSKHGSQLREKLKMTQIHFEKLRWETLYLPVREKVGGREKGGWREGGREGRKRGRETERVETLISFFLPIGPVAFHFTSLNSPFWGNGGILLFLTIKIPSWKVPNKITKMPGTQEALFVFLSH